MMEKKAEAMHNKLNQIFNPDPPDQNNWERILKNGHRPEDSKAGLFRWMLSEADVEEAKNRAKPLDAPPSAGGFEKLDQAPVGSVVRVVNDIDAVLAWCRYIGIDEEFDQKRRS